jgi:Zn finger protein HypA/HybF involved in hydrogenase expression
VNKVSIIWQMTKDEFQELVNRSSTYSEILKHFDMQNKGNNFLTVKKRIREDNIDMSIFNSNKIKCKITSKIHINNILVENSNYSRTLLKKRLIKNNLLIYQCDICGNEGLHNNKKLSLHLDHINGVNNDNRLENLRFLCPNCHSQTETFAGRRLKIKYYCECGTEKSKLGSCCIKCSRKKSQPKLRIDYPSKELLEKLLWEKPTVQIAKDYGVSDNAVAKWAKKYNLNKPSRGYWTKVK